MWNIDMKIPSNSTDNHCYIFIHTLLKYNYTVYLLTDTKFPKI